MPQRTLTFILLGLTSLIVACADPASEPASSPESVNVESGGQADNGDEHDATEEAPMTESEPQAISLNEAVDAARKDLAERIDRSMQEVVIADARRVTWANGALGCPEEGMMYTQALVDGYYIRLQADGRDYDYHAGREGKPFYCPAERSRRPPQSDKPEM